MERGRKESGERREEDGRRGRRREEMSLWIRILSSFKPPCPCRFPWFYSRGRKESGEMREERAIVERGRKESGGRRGDEFVDQNLIIVQTTVSMSLSLVLFLRESNRISSRFVFAVPCILVHTMRISLRGGGVRK